MPPVAVVWMSIRLFTTLQGTTLRLATCNMCTCCVHVVIDAAASL